MARDKKYESAAERTRAYRERRREKVDPDLPEVDVAQVTEAVDRDIDTLIALDPLAPLTDTEEDAVRSYFGYASSETRTRAERAGVAKRIEARMGSAPTVYVGRDLDKGIVARVFEKMAQESK